MNNTGRTWVLCTALLMGAASLTPGAGYAHDVLGTHEAASDGDFFAWADASGAVRLERTIHVGKAPMVRTHGVRVFVPAKPGLSAAYLTQVIEQRLERGASQSDGSDPFAVSNLQVTVRPAGGGFLVSLTSEDVDSAREVLERVRARIGG